MTDHPGPGELPGHEAGAEWELEIVRLNAADLDVTGLEQRLELAGLLPSADCWQDNSCNHFSCNNYHK